jgi:hypothetical protein
MRQSVVGEFKIPAQYNEGTASFTVPGITVAVRKNKRSSKKSEVTHRVFFGENIKRARKALRSK